MLIFAIVFGFGTADLVFNPRFSADSSPEYFSYNKNEMVFNLTSHHENLMGAFKGSDTNLDEISKHFRIQFY